MINEKERAISNSINYGIDKIIERAISEESRWLINYIKNKFEKEIYPLFNEHKFEKEKSRGNILQKNRSQKNLKNFWKEIPETFNYKFGKLEWLTLTNTPNGALYFIYKLCSKYIEKFYSDSKVINHPISELYSLVTEIYWKQIEGEEFKIKPSS